MLIKKTTEIKELKDSGDRTTFSTGSVKDMQPGRGRYDLVPFSIVNELLDCNEAPMFEHKYREITSSISAVLNKDDIELKKHLTKRAFHFLKLESKLDNYEVIDALAKIYEAGLIKYPVERDWEKGRPTDVYANSALRHTTQHFRGYKDENHIVAAMWNLVSLYHTLRVFADTDLIYQNPHTK